MPPKVKKVSGVWVHFSKVSDDGQDNTPKRAKCKLCEMEITNTGGNTTSMKNHLKRRHDIEIFTTPDSDTEGSLVHQPTLQEVLSKRVKLDDNSAKKIRIDELVTGMIVKDLQPFSLVEDEGFRELLKFLEPRYVIPTRKTVSTKLISSAYETATKKLKEIISQYMKGDDASPLVWQPTVCITTDAWTSRNASSYITYTCHFINSDYQLDSYQLGTYEVSDSHTAATLKSHMSQTLREWFSIAQTGELSADMEGETDDIPGGIVFFLTTDNAMNISNAVRDNGFPHVRCFAHTLNLAVQKGLKVVSKQLARIRTVATYFHKSAQGSAALMAEQQTSAAPNQTGKKMIIDVTTRWNSTLDMITRYLEISSCVYAALQKLKKRDLLKHIVPADLEVLETLKSILEPFKQVTVLLSSENNCTVSLIRPLLHQLMTTVKPDPDLNESTAIHELKATIYNDLDKRYKTVTEQELLDVATALDPRVKTTPYLSPEEKAKLHDRLCSKMVAIDDRDEGKCESSKPSESASKGQSGYPCLLQGLLGNMYSSSGDSSLVIQGVDETVKDELTAYMARPLCPMELSPLTW